MSRAARMISSVVLILPAAIGTAEAANTEIAGGCGIVKGGGRAWQVTAVAFPCADAKKLIRRLIPKVPASGAGALVTHSTMQCTAAVAIGKHGIFCESADGRLVQAFTK